MKQAKQSIFYYTVLIDRDTTGEVVSFDQIGIGDCTTVRCKDENGILFDTRGMVTEILSVEVFPLN